MPKPRSVFRRSSIAESTEWNFSREHLNEITSRFRKRQLGFAALLVLIGVLLGTLYAFWGQSISVIERASRFESDSSRLSDFLTRAAHQNHLMVGVMHRYVNNVNNNVSHEGFASFADEFSKQGVEFEAIQYAPQVTRSERDAFEQEEAEYWTRYYAENNINATYPGFTKVGVNDDGTLFHPRKEDADFYRPYQYMWPVEGNIPLIGYDMLAWNSERETITGVHSRPGNLALTRRVLYLDDRDPTSTSYSVLLIRGGDTPAEGLVVQVLRIKSLLRQAFYEVGTGLEAMLFDDTSEDLTGSSADFLGGSVSYTNGYFDTLEAVDYSSFSDTERFTKKHFFEFGNRRWILVTHATDSYQIPDNTTVITGAVMVSLLGFLLAGWYLFDANNHHKIQFAIKQGEAEAKAERSVNAFLAHEVRNPLSIALSAAQFTQSTVQAGGCKDTDVKEAVMNDVKLIQTSLRFIHELLDNMLDIRKIEDGQMAVKNATISILHDVLIPVKSMLDREANHIKMVVDTEDDPLWVVADGLRIKQIVMNLAKNAIKFTHEGCITLYARRNENIDSNDLCGGGVVIKVQDTGPGVPPGTRDVLFQKYGSLEHSCQGTGLGLYLCNAIVTHLKGKVYLDENYTSPKQGSPGACFVVDLPLEMLLSLPGGDSELEVGTLSAQPSERLLLSPVNSDNASLANCKRSCLIVDDDALVRVMLQRQVLKIWPDWDVHSVASGEAALDLVKNSITAYDVYFMDQFMPGLGRPMTGAETIVAMRKLGVIGFFVGCSANDVENTHMSAGADAFLRKPFSSAAISEAVHKVFANLPLRTCLIVDDDKITRTMVRRTLKQLLPRCAFAEACSAEEAMQMIADKKHGRPYDVIFLDEYMGAGMNGSEAAMQLRELGCSAKLVSLSGGHTELFSKGGGFDLCWLKPLPDLDDMKADLYNLMMPVRNSEAKLGNGKASSKVTHAPSAGVDGDSPYSDCSSKTTSPHAPATAGKDKPRSVEVVVI